MVNIAKSASVSTGELLHPLFNVRCDRPFLVATFQEPHTVLSWAVARPGFETAREVVWLEVHESELPVDVDHKGLLDRRLSAAGLTGAVAMMTSRDVRCRRLSSARSGQVSPTQRGSALPLPTRRTG